MTRIAQNKVFNAGFAKYGYHDWHVKVAGKAVVRRVTPEGVSPVLSDYLKVVFYSDVLWCMAWYFRPRRSLNGTIPI